MPTVQELRQARRDLVASPRSRPRDAPRRCAGCGESFHWEEFGGNHHCKTCWRLGRYGLTPETYALLPGADGICALCKDAPSTHIDHDHACCPGRRGCGKCVRAVLCSTCNHRLGHLEGLRDAGLLDRALAHIQTRV